MEVVAAIDLGSRNFKLVMGQLDGRLLRTSLLGKVSVHLGREVAAHGSIRSKRLRAAVAALHSLDTLGRAHGAQIIAVMATAAIRKAANRDEVLEVLRVLGPTAPVELLGGVREAQLGYLAATCGRDGSLMAEFGSSSTQVAWSLGGELHTAAGVIGYEQIWADHVQRASSFAHAREAVRADLSPLLWLQPPEQLHVVALAANSSAAFIRGCPHNEAADRPLCRSEVSACVAALCTLDGASLAAMKEELPKAPKVLTGVLWLELVLERTGQEELLVSRAELPTGKLVEHFLARGHAIDALSFTNRDQPLTPG